MCVCVCMCVCVLGSPKDTHKSGGTYKYNLYIPLFIVASFPRPLPDFISQPWRKIGRRPGIKTMSRTGNGGLGQYKPSPPFPVHDVVLIPGLLPIFLHGCEINLGGAWGRGYLYST